MWKLNFGGFRLDPRLVEGAMDLRNCSAKEAKQWLRDKPKKEEVSAFMLEHPGWSKKESIHFIRRMRLTQARLQLMVIGARRAEQITAEDLMGVFGNVPFGSRVRL
ncbi:hypothetical protein KW800_01425 [Candidatus Parcubacteria bacterium]|nr:hypothetical protein [Candidatus Parcubacteria bacterium]